jgi:glycosyltransferase involved in cell wall biosynthesis
LNRLLAPLFRMSERLRALMLATYFPKPGNPLMGRWALEQAQALCRRADLDLEVVSLTPWIPSLGARSGKMAAYAHCPTEYCWGSLKVRYPRCLWYPVEPLKSWAFHNPRLQLQLAWHTASGFLSNLVNSFQPDLVYAHHSAVNGYFAERLHSRFRLPYAITDHDFAEIAECRRWPGRKRFFEPIVSHASKMVAVASRMETEMRALFPDARTCTIANGTDPIPQQLQDRPRQASLEGKLVLFSCGTFYERKGFPLLIEAFARISLKHPTALLRIAGDGDQRPQIEEAIRRFSLQDRVQLLGLQPHKTVLQEMCWCDAFVLLGWDEPFATVFSEAMAAGKPLVCCDDGGINDVARDEVHGLTVPPKDATAAAHALDRILANGALRQRLGRNARTLFETSLRWDHNAAKMVDIFRSAASRQPTLDRTRQL